MLGIDDGLSPYQLIAADANNNGKITIRDLIMIREVILGLEEDFNNNNSWRFIPKDYVFPDPTNPWQERFPEVANFNNLEGQEFVEFVAIKVGDVNGNAEPHNGNALPPGDAENLATIGWQQNQRAGTWALYAGAGEGMQAMQFSLELPAKTLVQPGLITAAEYTTDTRGYLHVSYAPGQLADIPSDQPLLTLSGPELKCAPGFLRSAEALPPEGYLEDLSTHGLRFIVAGLNPTPPATAMLYPNPSRGATHLQVDWAVAETLTLYIYDVSGRQLQQRPLAIVSGSNQITLRADAFGPAGVYLLRLMGGEGREVVVRAVRE